MPHFENLELPKHKFPVKCLFTKFQNPEKILFPFQAKIIKKKRNIFGLFFFGFGLFLLNHSVKIK